MDLEYPRCELCHRRHVSRLFSVRDRRYEVPGEFDLVECAACSFRFLSPRPTPESIGRYYPDQYQTYNPAPSRPVGWTDRMRDAYRRLFSRSYPTYYFARHRHDFVRDGIKPRILDVGCGSGQKLCDIKRSGWETYGVDFSAKAASNARAAGVDHVYVVNAEAMPFRNSYFDAVMSWHSLEHHYRVRATLREMFRVLRPGGYSIIAVPSGQSMGLRLFRSYWGPLEAPRHLYHFTKATLSTLCENAGFRVVEIFHDFHFYGLFLDQEIFESIENVLAERGLSLKLPRPAWLGALFEMAVLPVNETLGRIWRGSNLIFHLEKPASDAGGRPRASAG